MGVLKKIFLTLRLSFNSEWGLNINFHYTYDKYLINYNNLVSEGPYV